MTQEEVEKAFAGLSPYFAYKQGLQDAVAYTWDAFRREAAKDILCALMQCGIQDTWRIMCENAINGADELIAKLKEK